MQVFINRLMIAEAPTVFDWVMRLLTELGEEGEELGRLDEEKVLRAWRERGEHFQVFAAKNSAGEILGMLTLNETFAIYANGNYGVIDEMYVAPEYRSAGVGGQLIAAVKAFGKQKGWTRIDVTAPEAERWERTRHFYEQHGFVFTGPKLKFIL